MTEIIDFHTHPFISEQNNTCFYNDTVSGDTILSDMKRAGITHFCGSIIRKTDVKDFGTIAELNSEALMLRDKFGDAYTPGIHIHPDFVDESIAEIHRMYNAGVRLIGELVPYMMGWSKYYDKNLHMIFEEAQTLGMTVSAHTAADSPDLAMSLEKAAVCFPRLNFVAAHPGDKKSFEAHIERLKKYDNFYLDLSGTGIFRYGMLKYGINKAGSEKFLFGTDYPICNAGMYVNAVLYENLNTEDMENVFFKNAKRILGIE